MTSRSNFKEKNEKNDSEFWAVWIENQPTLQAFCLNWLNGNHASAEDVLSLTIEKAHDHFLTSSEPVRNPFSWFYKIAYNLCIDLHREQKKQNYLYDLVAACPEEYFFSKFESEELDEEFQKDDQLNKIYIALNSMTLDLKKAVYYRFINEMDYCEIAANMQITPENARKRVQLAKEKLRELVI